MSKIVFCMYVVMFRKNSYFMQLTFRRRDHEYENSSPHIFGGMLFRFSLILWRGAEKLFLHYRVIKKWFNADFISFEKNVVCSMFFFFLSTEVETIFCVGEKRNRLGKVKLIGWLEKDRKFIPKLSSFEEKFHFRSRFIM